jgi:hypothetical protein
MKPATSLPGKRTKSRALLLALHRRGSGLVQPLNEESRGFITRSGDDYFDAKWSPAQEPIKMTASTLAQSLTTPIPDYDEHRIQTSRRRRKRGYG